MQLTEVKERPILFSTPMVQSILQGRKTMTRRIVKGEALKWLEPNMFTPKFVADPENNLCPYGKVGDILWVRETWCKGCTINRDDERSDMRYYYKADTDWQEHEWDHPTKEGPQDSPIWKPSIFMKKEACRIFLEITDIRIERLQDISEEDAQAEGVYFYGNDDPDQLDYKNYLHSPDLGDDWGCRTAKESFQSLWWKINGKESWISNPFVWVISFKKK